MKDKQTHHMICTSEWPEKHEILKAAERLEKDSKSLSNLSTMYSQECKSYDRIADFLKYLANRMK